MTTYTVRPTALIDKDNTIQGTSNSGGAWATASDANIVAYTNDSSDTTGIRSSGSGSRWFQVDLGAPTIASDEFVCRVAGFVRWSGGKAGEYVGCNPYLLTEAVPGGTGAIATDGRVTPTTNEPGYIPKAWTIAEMNLLALTTFMDGDATAATRPVIWELGANVYTLKLATAAPHPTTMTTSTTPTIPVDVTATIDWEAGSYTWQNLRKVTVEVRVESGGTGVGTGTLMTTATKDQYFTATGTLTVSVPTSDSIANGTYNVYARTIRHREDETSPAADQYGPWSTAATLTMSMTPPTAPTLTVTADDTTDRIQLAITAPASGGYSSPYVTAERSDDNGVTWVSVRGATAVASSFGVSTFVYDYEAARGVTVQYRARVSAYTSGVLNTSTTSSVATTSLTYDTWNLKCPQAPNLNMIGVTVVGNPSETITEDLGIFRPDGRRYPVVVAGTVSGWDGELSIVTSNSTEWAQLKAIIEAGAVLFLESAFGWSKYIRLSAGAKAELSGTATTPRRRITAQYVETSQPADTFLTLATEIVVTTDGGSATTAVWDDTYDGGIASTVSFASTFDGGSAA